MKLDAKVYEAERVKLLYRDNSSTLLLAIAGSLVFYFVYQNRIDELGLDFLLVLYISLSVIRHIVCLLFKKKQGHEKNFNYLAWENLFAGLTLLSGISYAFIIYNCFLPGEYLLQGFCIAMAFGYSSGAVIGYSASMKSVIGVTAPFLGSLVFALVFKGGEDLHYILSILAFFYLLNALRGAKAVNEMILREVERRVELIQNSKMGALGEMASGMAHEINNPLTIVYGNMNIIGSIIKKDPINKDLLKSKLELVNNNVKRITQIISDLRSYSRNITEEDNQETTIEIIVERIRNFSDSRISKESVFLDFLVELTPERTVMCRPLELNQAIVNLIHNSVDAIKEQEQKWIKIHIFERKNEYVFRIIDSGKGIDPYIVERMMNPFYTTKKINQGTGLGLSTTKGIIEAHGGELSYNDEFGHTCFDIIIPQKLN